MTDNLNRDYQIRVVTTAAPDEVFDALTTLEGLSAWWAPAHGSAAPGGEITFSFDPGSQAVMRVDAAERASRVQWTTTACMLEDWVGTRQHFEFEPLPDGGTAINFRHVGLTPQLECFDQCRSGWNHFIPSLRAYLDTGAGQPTGSAGDHARRQQRAATAAAGAAGAA